MKMVSFERPADYLSMNSRGHWRKYAGPIRLWRTTAFFAARDARVKGRWPTPLEPSVVEVSLPVPDRRRRDPHNLFATVKPIVDGLVDAGLWPDDTPEWVTTMEPRLVLHGDLVVVSITARS